MQIAGQDAEDIPMNESGNAVKELVMIDLNNENHCRQLLVLLNYYMEDEMGMGESMPAHLGPSIITGLKKHPRYRGFFVLMNGEYAALANCNLNYSTFAAQPLLNIHDIIVHPSFRGGGVGQFLLDGISEYAKREGCSKVTLEVREDNIKAKNLYKKAGFSEGPPRYFFWEKNLE